MTSKEQTPLCEYPRCDCSGGCGREVVRLPDGWAPLAVPPKPSDVPLFCAAILWCACVIAFVMWANMQQVDRHRANPATENTVSDCEHNQPHEHNERAQ